MQITREFAEAFFEDLMTRDPARIEPYVADEADWLIFGPIELFPFCGQHYGKAAVLEAYGRLGARAAVTSHARDFMITDGECVSALSRMTSLEHATGREVTARLAQFARFRDGKVVEFCSVFDALGAIEQIIGHPLVEAIEDVALVD